MTDAQIQAPGTTRADSLRKITLFDYGLHIASPIVSMMLLSIIALVINYFKLGDTRGTIYESHMRNMISTFWWTAFWLVITGILSFFTIGLLSWAMVIPVLWYLYRNIRGLLRALDGRAA
jgi:uncharacterized membrane protein